MKLSCSTEVKSIRPEALKQILDHDKKGEIVLVDVRQPEEYEAGHIPGAVLIPLGELENRYGELEKDKRILTYCRLGHRSKAAAMLLCGLGFKDVQTMDGGIQHWDYEILTGLPKEMPELITGKEEIGDIMMIALKSEKGSFEFYLREADKLTYQKAKEMFQRLAQIEQQHMKRIYDLYGTVLGKDSLPAFDQLKTELTTEYLEGGIEINKALLSMEQREFKDELEVLEVALEKEYTSYDFYKRTAGSMGETDTRALLHELASEERNHIDHLLNKMREAVRGELQ
jgi:rhodanese-related sulfurtransferase/rubrerythrin